MEHLVTNLYGTLLIASPQHSQGRFLTLATGILFVGHSVAKDMFLVSENGLRQQIDHQCSLKVDVVALECESTEDIPAFLTTLKEDLEKCEQTSNVENSIRWCSDILKLPADPVAKKQIPEYLKKEVNAHLNPAPKPEQMIFLCGCTYINK